MNMVASDSRRAPSESVRAIIEAMKEIADSGNKNWRTLPPAAYCSDEIFQLEKEKIFRPGWIVIGRPEQVPNPGDYMSVDVIGEPLVMVRDRGGVVRVLSRVCRHRWAPVCDGNGNATAFVCPYHAWSFNLDGSLRNAPAMEETPNFDRQTMGLFEVRHEIWQGFVYINLDGKAAPLSEQMAPLSREIKEFRLSEWKTVRSRDYGECPWDWKVFMDNGECYHHIGAHKDTFEVEFPGFNSWDSPNNGEYVLTWCRASESSIVVGKTGERVVSPIFSENILPGLTDQQRLNMCLIYVFPNYFIVPSPDITTYVRMFPLGAGRIRWFLDYLVPPHMEDGPELQAKLDELEVFVNRFNDEDMAVCSFVQRGVQSAKAVPAPLSKLEGINKDFAIWVSKKLTG
jgi:phenylpropionate dioxygenase-like ring-hydroxylating dioxygenase large terminal subunit